MNHLHQGVSVTIPHRAEVPSCETSAHSMWRQLPARAGFPLHRVSFSTREFTRCQYGLCASDHPMAHATICPQAIPSQERLESWSRHRLLQLISWKMGGGRHSPRFMWRGQRDVVIARGMCDGRVKRRSNSCFCACVCESEHCPQQSLLQQESPLPWNQNKLSLALLLVGLFASDFQS